MRVEWWQVANLHAGKSSRSITGSLKRVTCDMPASLYKLVYARTWLGQWLPALCIITVSTFEFLGYSHDFSNIFYSFAKIVPFHCVIAQVRLCSHPVISHNPLYAPTKFLKRSNITWVTKCKKSYSGTFTVEQPVNNTTCSRCAAHQCISWETSFFMTHLHACLTFLSFSTRPTYIHTTILSFPQISSFPSFTTNNSREHEPGKKKPTDD